MSNKLIKLKLITEKNCFLNIPRSWREEIQQKVKIFKFKLEFTN